MRRPVRSAAPRALHRAGKDRSPTGQHPVPPTATRVRARARTLRGRHGGLRVADRVERPVIDDLAEAAGHDRCGALLLAGNAPPSRTSTTPAGVAASPPPPSSRCQRSMPLAAARAGGPTVREGRGGRRGEEPPAPLRPAPPAPVGRTRRRAPAGLGGPDRDPGGAAAAGRGAAGGAGPPRGPGHRLRGRAAPARRHPLPSSRAAEPSRRLSRWRRWRRAPPLRRVNGILTRGPARISRWGRYPFNRTGSAPSRSRPGRPARPAAR